MSSKKRIKNVVKKSHRDSKISLIQMYGTRCWKCGRNVNKMIQYHHIIPRYAGGEPVDISNGSLLCATCHVEIHQYQYGTDEYEESIIFLLDYKKRHKSQNS